MCSRCDGERTRPRVPQLAPSPIALRRWATQTRLNLCIRSADPRGRRLEHARARVLPIVFALLAFALMLNAASTKWPSISSGFHTLASTSFSNVKCLTISFGRAVIASVKCVIAGKKPGGWLALVPFSIAVLKEPRSPKGLEAMADERGGFVRVCLIGCDRRFMVSGG